MRHSTPRTLRCELLESRDQPSNTVAAAVVGGVLTLTGNDENNAVSLKQVGTTIEVTGLTGTTITGGTSFPNVTAVRAALGDGNDYLEIDNTSPLSLPGAVTVDLGDGNNTLSLSTAGKLDLGSLAVTAGDGYDIVFVAGGAGLGSKITGNVSLSLGVGINSQSPPYLDTQITFQGMDLTGAAGLAVTAQDGDELLTLTDVRVTRAVTANGGDGSFDVVSTGSTLGSMSLTSVGRQPSNPYDGTTLTATGTTVVGPVALKSGAGVRLQYTGGSTGPVSVTAGPSGFTTNDFHGTTTVNGNVTVKGYRNSMTAQAGADLTVTGDVTITSTTYSSLSASEAILRARNVTVSGTGGADFTANDYLPENTANLIVGGSLLIKGQTASYYQYGGQATIATKLSILGVDYADFYTSTAFGFDAPKPKTTVTNGSLIVQGREANYYQRESEVTTKTGLSVLATADASYLTEERFQTEDPGNSDTYDSAAGARTTVTAGKLTVRGGTSAYYFQSEGDASFAGGVSVLSARGSASFRTGVGDGYNSVGAKTTSTGALLVQGASAEFGHEGGQTTFPTGLSVLGREGAQFRVDTGETHDPNFDFFDVPADTTVANGPVTVKGGTGEVMFLFDGDALAVGGDLSLSGQSHHRVWFFGDTGTTIGGKFTQTGATAEHDWLIVGAPFSVAGDATVALGSGANYIELGSDGGPISVGGNLSLTTGNGSDVLFLESITVTGATTINTGAGTDQLSILGPATFTGPVTIDLGAGADTVAIANVAGQAGPVTFNGPSRIKFGGGNDTVVLGLAASVGGDANSRVAFAASGFLTLDGGTNLNWFDDEVGQFDAANVTPIGFTDPNDP